MYNETKTKQAQLLAQVCTVTLPREMLSKHGAKRVTESKSNEEGVRVDEQAMCFVS